MTDADLIDNVTLDSGGSNELTLFATQIEHIQEKTLIKISPPQSTSNKALGPKPTKIVDLLRIEERYTLTGFINTVDATKYRDLIRQGGVFDAIIDGSTISVNVDKATNTKLGAEENPERNVIITLVEGVDI